MPVPLRVAPAQPGRKEVSMTRTNLSRRRRLGVALLLQLALVAGEAVASVVAHSAALVADAGHNLVDAIGIGLASFAIVLTARSRSDKRSYGNYRATILVALANTAAIAGVSAAIIAVSVVRLIHPVKVDGPVIIAAAGASVVLNGMSALILREGEPDLNMRAIFYFQATDMVASLAVVVAGIIVSARPSLYVVDALAPLLVAGFIIQQAWGLSRHSVHVLLESTPAGMDVRAMLDTMERVEGVEEVRDLHVWSLSSELHALSAHVVVSGSPSLDSAQRTVADLKRLLHSDYSVAHVTLELESERCAEGVDDPCFISSIEAQARGSG